MSHRTSDIYAPNRNFFVRSWEKIASVPQSNKTDMQSNSLFLKCSEQLDRADVLVTRFFYMEIIAKFSLKEKNLVYSGCSQTICGLHH